MVDHGDEFRAVTRIGIVDILQHDRAIDLRGTGQNRCEAFGCTLEQDAAQEGVIGVVQRVPEGEGAVDHHMRRTQRAGHVEPGHQALLHDGPDGRVGRGDVEAEEGPVDPPEARDDLPAARAIAR